ncbi:MAG: hypothetical protein ACT4QA_01085 [Panacagrimonas sp.]
MRAAEGGGARFARSVLPGAVLVLSGVVQLSPAQAAEYFLDPLLSLSGLYETNPRLRQDSEEVGGGVLEAALEFGARSPVSLLSLTPRIETFRYNDDKTLNRTDGGVGLTLERALSSTFKLGTTALGSRVSTLVSEADDSGVVGRRDRDTRSVSPYLSWRVGVRDELVTRFSYTDIEYDEEDIDRSGLVDHDLRVATLLWNRQWTASTQGFVEAFGSEFRNKEFDCQTRSIGGKLGLEVALTPTVTINGSAGYVASDADFETLMSSAGSTQCNSPPPGDAAPTTSPGSETSGNPLGSIGIRKEFSAVSSARAGYDRAISASGVGVQTIRDRFSVGFDQTLTERLRLSLDGSYQKSEADVDEGPVPVRSNDVALIDLEFRYKLSEDFYIGTGYRYRYRKRESLVVGESDDDEENNTATVFIGYDPKPRTLMR